MAVRTSHPLCPDRPLDIYNGPGTVLSQERYAPNCWKMVVEVPWKGEVTAGQFAHILCDEERTFPLLRRPFSFWDVRPTENGQEMDLVYTVVGTGTAILEEKKPGDTVGVLAPLGRGFTKRDPDTYIFVAGGVGIVPFYHFARQLQGKKIILIFGARDESMLYGIDDFPKLGVEALAATEDGSRGYRGRVTGLLLEELPKHRNVMLYSCGPEPMLEAVMEIAREKQLPCEVSMEKRMGCALGACAACVTTVKDGDDWRYSRICIEGPCYDADTLVPGRV